MTCDVQGCGIKQYVGEPFGRLYEGIEHTVEVADYAVPSSEEVPKPILTFNLMDCVIPTSKFLTDPFNSGFKLVATAFLSGPATLFFGVGTGGNMTVMGNTPAICETYPCEGIVEVKWMIGREPSMAEFLELLGFPPIAGSYDFDFSVGYLEGDIPVATDAIQITLTLKEGKSMSGLIMPATFAGLGAFMYMV